MPVRTPDPSTIEYFANVRAAFECAEGAGEGGVTRRYRIGRHDIRLNFAGPALVPLLSPAFEHLTKGMDSPEALQVILWDSESTGIDIPRPPWDVEDFVRKGEIWRFSDRRFRITYNPCNGTYNLIDMDQNLAIYQACSAGRTPQYENGSPLLQILEWWFDREEEYILHAGAVGTTAGGVLLVGKGGSGKSTTALACLDSDLLYVSDDYCLLANSESPYVSSLYNSAKVNRNETHRFPFLETALSSHPFSDSNKALYFISEYQTSKISLGFPVRAVLVPHVTGLTGTDLGLITPAQALLSLAPSTIFHFPGTENRVLRKMSRLVKQVPCYALNLGTDLSTIADCVMRVLR